MREHIIALALASSLAAAVAWSNNYSMSPHGHPCRRGFVVAFAAAERTPPVSGPRSCGPPRGRRRTAPRGRARSRLQR
eukprot:7499939-Pyramimonas_sp.AAC.1